MYIKTFQSEYNGIKNILSVLCNIIILTYIVIMYFLVYSDRTY